MRGKENRVLRRVLRVGITPACAGKSLQRAPVRFAKRDHPRVCGEKKALKESTCALWGSPPHVTVEESPGHLGSPPHMRGKGLLYLRRHSHVRITPAHAGEKQQSALGDFSGKGSPPRMRGKVHVQTKLCVVVRITPAYAGKSQGLNIFHTKRSSGPSPAAVPAGPAGSCPASRPSQFPPRMTVIRPRP